MRKTTIHFIATSCYCCEPLVGIGYPKNLLPVKMKIASHNARNQFESSTSRKEREKWGTLRFITEKWVTPGQLGQSTYSATSSGGVRSGSPNLFPREASNEQLFRIRVPCNQ